MLNNKDGPDGTPSPQKNPPGPAGPVQLPQEELSRLGQVLNAEAPAFARHLSGGAPQIEALAQPFFTGHRVLEVQSTRAFPARTLHVIRDPQGAYHVLTGQIARLNAAAQAEPPSLPDEGAARAYANLGDGWTSESELGDLLLESFDDIPWVPGLNAVDRAIIDSLRESVSGSIHPPELRKEDGGYVLAKWVLENRRLIHRELHLGKDGQLRRTDEVMDRDLPVYPGHLWGLVGDRLVPIG